MFQRIHPFAVDESSSRGKVYSPHETGQSIFCQFRFIFGHKILSWNDSFSCNLHPSILGLFEDHLEDSPIFACILAAGFPELGLWSEMGLPWLTFSVGESVVSGFSSATGSPVLA